MPTRSDYRRRIIDAELAEYLEAASEATVAVALEGARAIGKTSSAGERTVTRYDLDDDTQLAVVRCRPPARSTGSGADRRVAALGSGPSRRRRPGTTWTVSAQRRGASSEASRSSSATQSYF